MAYRAQTFGQLLQHHAPGLVVLAQVRAYERIAAWTLTSGKTYTYQAPIAQYLTVHGVRTIDTVKVSDPSAVVTTPVYAAPSNTPVTNQITSTSLTSRASVALVEANLGSFYHDLTVGLLYVSLSSGKTPVGCPVLAGFLLYFSPGMPTLGQAAVFDGIPYWPYLQGVPEIRKSTSNPYFGVISQGGGTLSLAAGTGALDPTFKRYTWETGDVTILLGGDDLPYSEYQAYRGFKTRQRKWSENQINLDVVDIAQSLMVRFPRTLFIEADTTQAITYLRGGTGLSVSKTCVSVEAACATTRTPIGQPKPLAYGPSVDVSPIAMALSASAGIWCLAHHPNYSVTSVTVGSEVIGQTGIGTVADWYVDSTKSMLYVVRHGTTVDLSSVKVTVTLNGKMDANLVPMDNFADVVKDLVEVECGLTAGFHTATLDLSRFLCNLYQASVYITAEDQLATVLDNIMRSTLAYFFVDDAGLYRYVVWYPSMAGEVSLDEAWGDFLALEAQSDDSRMYRTVAVEYGAVGGQYQRVSVTRPESVAVLLDRAVDTTIEKTYQATESGAYVLATRFARFSAQPAVTYPFKGKIRPIAHDLLTKTKLVKERLPMETGHTVHGEAVTVSREFTGFTCSLGIGDQRVIGTQGFLAPNGALLWSAATPDEQDTQGFWTYYSGLIEAGQPASWGRSRWF